MGVGDMPEIYQAAKFGQVDRVRALLAAGRPGRKP